MKKLVFYLILAFLIVPSLAFSAENLASKLVGRILLDVDDRGRTYYVAPDGFRYQITKDSALEIFQKLALGITHENLSEIPLNDVGIEPEGVKEESPIENPVENEPIIVSEVQGEVCDYSTYTSQITDLNSQITSLNSQIVSLNSQVSSLQNQLNVGVIEPEVNKEVRILTEENVVDSQGVRRYAFKIIYFENLTQTEARVNISANNGYFVGSSQPGKPFCTGGIPANSSGSQTKGSNITCPTIKKGISFGDVITFVNFSYIPFNADDVIITATANGATASITVKGQTDKCSGKVTIDNQDCNL